MDVLKSGACLGSWYLCMLQTDKSTWE